MSKLNISRRGLLQGLGAAAGLAAGSRIVRPFAPLAHAADGVEKNVLVVLYMNGGYNSLFTGPDAFLTGGDFGVQTGNVAQLGNGLYVDKLYADNMPQFALDHMASIGVRHGISDHGNAHRMTWTDGNRAYPLQLAAAMGGDAAIKCAALGDTPDMDGVSPPTEGGVSFQVISNMDATIRALGGGAQDPKIPARNVASKAIAASETMSGNRLSTNGKSLVTMKNGYDTAIETLTKPIKPFNFADIATPYGASTTSFGVGNFRSKLIAAELMIQAGANVITLDGPDGWDSHGDTNGTDVRNQMQQDVLPNLSTFLTRIYTDPMYANYNVVFSITGEFARSLPGSDHQPNITNTVIGKYVKQGTTGRTDANVDLKAGTPSVPGWWAFMAAALKLPATPFGNNPHPLIL